MAVVDGDLVVSFLDADGVAGDAAATEDAVAMVADLAGTGDFSKNGAGGIGDVGELGGPGSRAGLEAADGRLVAQGFVRPEGVVDAAISLTVLAEVIEELRRALKSRSSRSAEPWKRSTLPWVWG